MRRIVIFKRQKFMVRLIRVFCIFLILLISGCGDGGDDNLSSSPETASGGFSETGSAVFTIVWHDDSVVESSEGTLITAQAEPVDCGIIANIICKVYDGSNDYLTSEVFDCSAGTGTIDNIPVGTNRKFVILGEDDGENILHHGEVSGKTIAAGQTTNVGAIDIYPFVPTGLEAVSVSSSQINLYWDASIDNIGVAGYNLYDENGSVIYTGTLTSYNDAGLIPSTEHCYTISAYDAVGNESMQSSPPPACAVTKAEGPCIYTIDPPNMEFTWRGENEMFGSFEVKTTNGCDWSATLRDDGWGVDWIDITSGSGTGNGTVSYTVSALPPKVVYRFATILVAGQIHQVIQNTDCRFSIIPDSLDFTWDGGTGHFEVDTQDYCYWWLEIPDDDSWITVTFGDSNRGPGTVDYHVGAWDGNYTRSGDINLWVEEGAYSPDKIHNVIQESPLIIDITITGSTQVSESSGAQYALVANYSNGSSVDVTNSASWSENSDYASISSSGFLTTFDVGSDQSCTITATYAGISTTFDLIIGDIPIYPYAFLKMIDVGSGDSILSTAVYNGGHILVSNSVDRTVSIVETSKNEVINTIHLGFTPYHIALTPDGNYLYVTHRFATEKEKVSVFQTVDFKRVDVISNLGPYCTQAGEIAVTSDGKQVVVGCEGHVYCKVYIFDAYPSDDVHYEGGVWNPCIDFSGGSVQQIVAIDDRIYCLFYHISSGNSYVNYLNSSESRPEFDPDKVLLVGRGVYNIAISTDNNFVYAAANHDDLLNIFDLSGYIAKLVGKIEMPGPYSVAVLPNGRFVYTGDIGGNNEIRVIDTSLSKELDPIQVGSSVAHSEIAVPPDGNNVYVADGGQGVVCVIGFPN